VSEDSNAWDLVCKPQQCPDGTVEFASALHTATSKAQLGNNGISYNMVKIPPYTNPEFSFCCDPPSRYNQDWLVDPKNLWEHYYNNLGDSDVVWKYSNEFNNNNNNKHRASPGVEDGSDAYGFIMLDGPEGTINNSFTETQAVVC
jgi:chitinase